MAALSKHLLLLLRTLAYHWFGINDYRGINACDVLFSTGLYLFALGYLASFCCFNLFQGLLNRASQS